MKPAETDDELSEIDQECTIFSGVTYLGAAGINAPKSEKEIHRTMMEMNSSAGTIGLKVSVSIPTKSEGLVVLYDAATNAVVSTYEVQRILFYARGAAGSNDQACFAFTWSHGDTQDTAIFQCHVFRCTIPEAVTQVSTCFAKAFQRTTLPPSLTNSMTGSVVVGATDSIVTEIQSAMYEFNVSLEIREKVSKSNYATVPRDQKSCFKLRCNTDKEVGITVKQIPSDTLPPLYIERCFGVLLSPGRLVRQADMQLLDLVSMGYVKAEPTSNNSGQQSMSASFVANQVKLYTSNTRFKPRKRQYRMVGPSVTCNPNEFYRKKIILFWEHFLHVLLLGESEKILDPISLKITMLIV